MKHLTTIENIKGNVRFVSKTLDDKRIEPYITESEQLNIKSQIGDALFIDLLEYVAATDKTSFPDYSTLLNGGIYESTVCRTKEKRSFEGLIQCLNYYVWARIVKNNNYTLTRFGMVNKEEQHSSNAEFKERTIIERDALSVADKYLADCLLYLSAKKEEFPLFRKGIMKNRLAIKIIGK